MPGRDGHDQSFISGSKGIGDPDICAELWITDVIAAQILLGLFIKITTDSTLGISPDRLQGRR
jgi:hypothetical protein